MGYPGTLQESTPSFIAAPSWKTLGGDRIGFAGLPGALVCLLRPRISQEMCAQLSFTALPSRDMPATRCHSVGEYRGDMQKR
ncbi:hypothetical protein SZ64_02160 [Erythrobacter sp. SG61-1L]|nr:hypothetical protein SZ64_02160 [Erythrobacter sp. SG61-1L]